MKRKLYWGLGVFIVLFVIGGVFVYLDDRAEIKQLEKELAEAEKLKNKMNQLKVAGNKLTRDAKPGYEWENHGDHFHEVEIVKKQPVIQPNVKKQQAKPIDTGPLTYHKELLETHPVEALRQLATEQGHWSAEFIPPFPPDDLEAAELARAVYTVAYHSLTVPHPEDSHDHKHSVEYEQADQFIEEHRKSFTEWAFAINKASWEGRRKEVYNPDDLARWNDLKRLEFAKNLNRPPFVPLSIKRTWSSMFTDIRY